MKRRKFILVSVSTLGVFFSLSFSEAFDSDQDSAIPAQGRPKNDRDYWVKLMVKIADPILKNMSKGELRKNMAVDYSPVWDKNRNKDSAYMEAFGRLIAGLAPFLSLPIDSTEEGKLRKIMGEQVRASLSHATDPSSPDYLYWGSPESRQPLVDAAYIAQALLAAPDVFWTPLDAQTQQRVIFEFKRLRKIQPFNNNYVLFAAMLESFLLFVGEGIDAWRIDSAVDKMQNWYVGDGWYSDGDKFHFDHYNGYVIHPMLCEVLRVNAEKGRMDKSLFNRAYRRMQRYALIQERFISPEGFYPVFGRSSMYRAGLFQPLCKISLDHSLPDEITPAQVRSGLTAVLKHLFVPTTFNKAGFLNLGLVGDQQRDLADFYANTGSLYITSLVFLPLGLSEFDDFWSAPFTEWTQRKAWSGKPFMRDHAVDY
jgi:hypothetical protein